MSVAGAVTRFAPSPTGYLHLGHVYSALQAWQAARRGGGRFLLRLEDIDQTRCRAEFADAIVEELAWLGLAWDGPVRHQSQHFDDYRKALERLEKGGLLYPCFCTRHEIAAEIMRAGSAPHADAGMRYPGTCRGLGAAEAAKLRRSGRDHALRLNIGRALALTGPLDWIEEVGSERCRFSLDAACLSDVVLARKETPASYHLAVTVDDAMQGVTLVTRGEDLAPATHIHRLLQALLDLPTPRYRHHRLLTDATGRRLAKRDRAMTVRSLRLAGSTPEEILEKAQSSAR